MANFEEKLSSLEGIVERLERGELSLDESVKLFEEGMRLSAACSTELEAAEGRIQQLVERAAGSATGEMRAVPLVVETSLGDDVEDER